MNPQIALPDAVDESMNIVIIGHVDHGKSTLVGRLLADTGSLPEGKLESIKLLCERNSKVFEYAFLLDALDIEREQGITVDMARCFFRSEKRRYIILDAPGHIEFLKNMVTGASRAEAAVLLISGSEGIQENSRRHGLLASMLGVKKLIVAVNKMDLVDYDQNVFKNIEQEYGKYLHALEIEPLCFIPVAALLGENLVSPSTKMDWYQGPSVLQSLDQLNPEISNEKKDFRLNLQDIYKFTSQGDQRRIFAGRPDSGALHVGDEVLFLPSKKRSRVESIEIFGAESPDNLQTGKSGGFTLCEQIYVQRGELVSKTNETSPIVSRLIRVNIFWMGKKPLLVGSSYLFKLGTSKSQCKVIKIIRVFDSQNPGHSGYKDQVARHDVSELILELKKPIAFDLNSYIEGTSRFVVVEDFEICGGGIISEALETQTQPSEKLENSKVNNFYRSKISPVARAHRLGHSPALIIFTGPTDSNFKNPAMNLEQDLFNLGKFCYFFSMGNLKYGLDQDLAGTASDHPEFVRRLGELSLLFLDSGLITIVTARDLHAADLEVLKAIIEHHPLLVINSGKSLDFKHTINIDFDLNKNNLTQQVLEWLGPT